MTDEQTCIYCQHPVDAHARFGDHWPKIEGTDDEWFIGSCRATVYVDEPGRPASGQPTASTVKYRKYSYPCGCKSGRVRIAHDVESAS